MDAPSVFVMVKRSSILDDATHLTCCAWLIRKELSSKGIAIVTKCQVPIDRTCLLVEWPQTVPSCLNSDYGS